MPSEWVTGSSIRAARRGEVEPARPARAEPLRRQVRGSEGGGSAVGEAELGQPAATPSSMYQPPPAKSRGRSPRSWSQATCPARPPPGRRRSGAPARGRPVRVQTERAVRGRDARAGEPERLALAHVGSGGRTSAAISSSAGHAPGGRQRPSRSRRRAAARRGRRRRHRRSARPHIPLGWTRHAGSADCSLRRAPPTRRSSSG